MPRTQKEGVRVGNFGHFEPNLFKIIDIARALCYYKQADNRILHFVHRTSDVWRSTQEAEGAPLLRE